jgi:hypothetical protein
VGNKSSGWGGGVKSGYSEVHCEEDLNQRRVFTTQAYIYDGDINLLKPTGYVMHQKFNIQQLYALPTLLLTV